MITEFSVYLPAREKRRVDGLLSTLFPDESRSYIGRLCDKWTVLVNGKPTKKGTDVKPRDIIYVDWVREKSHIDAESMPLEIVFENDDFAIVNKDAGINVHPVPGAGGRSGTLVNGLLAHFSGLSVINGVERPGLVHRLDKDTSWALIIAKRDHAMRTIQKLIADRKMSKRYLALVAGRVGQNGLVESYLGRSTIDRKKMANVDEEHGKYAKTAFTIREYLPIEDVTLIEVDLYTGRMHQIRVHMASLGHPIIGDETYGFDRLNTKFREKHDLDRQFLHAWQLAFHYDGKDWQFTAPLKWELSEVLKKLGSKLEL